MTINDLASELMDNKTIEFYLIDNKYSIMINPDYNKEYNNLLLVTKLIGSGFQKYEEINYSYDMGLNLYSNIINSLTYWIRKELNI